MTPYRMDHRLNELAGKLLKGTLSNTEEQEREDLMTERRNRLCSLPSPKRWAKIMK